MFLVDTNVISEVRKRSPNPGVASWFSSVTSRDLFLSALVVGELRQGVERLTRRDPDQARLIGDWLDELVETFHDRIVPVGVDVAQTWGRLNAQAPLPVIDGLLAATALTHDWTLVTRNVGDVRRTGVGLLNPFT